MSRGSTSGEISEGKAAGALGLDRVSLRVARDVIVSDVLARLGIPADAPTPIPKVGAVMPFSEPAPDPLPPWLCGPPEGATK